MKNDIHNFKSVSLTNRRQQTDFWRAITGALLWLPSDPASLYCLLYFLEFHATAFFFLSL